MIRRMVSPVVVHGHTRLPGDVLSMDVLDPVRRDHLLRTDKITVVRRRISGGKGTIAFTADLQTIVDDHIRLQTAHHIDQLRTFPCFPSQFVIGKIKPENVDLSVIGTDLSDLVVHIGQITVKITVFIAALRMVPHRMVSVSVVRKIIVVPVDQRKIQPHLQAGLANRLHVLRYQVSAAFCVRGLEICVLAVEQTETVVVLRGQYHILHSRVLCRLRPFFRIVIGGVEFIKIFHIVFFRDFFHTPDPFSSCRYRVKPPVDKHAESGISVPFHSFFISCPVKLIHRFFSSLRWYEYGIHMSV